MAAILKVTSHTSEESIIDCAAQIVQRGGVIVYPTETIYGLGVDATNEQAIRKIFVIKGRNFANPISVIIGRREDVYPLVLRVTRAAETLMDFFWPGPLTIVFEAAACVSPLLTAGAGKIGIRLSGHDGARQIAQKAGKPLTATSANLSGASECMDAAAVAEQIRNQIDAIVDLGQSGSTTVSTIIDAVSESPIILRHGLITKEEIIMKTRLDIQ